MEHGLESFDLEAQGSTLGDFGLYSYGTALFAYFVLVVLAVITRRRSALGGPLLAACLCTAVWAATVTASGFAPEPLLPAMQTAEVARNAAWIFLLLRLLATRLAGTGHWLTGSKWLPWFAIAVTLTLSTILGAELLVERLTPRYDFSTFGTFGTWLLMAIAGLLTLEQCFRNSDAGELWAIKHLGVGLGIMFAYDFFMYAEALLFSNLDRNLWQARGAVNAMAAVLIAISLSRAKGEEHPEEVRRIYLSRHVAFHTLTLMASGIYLITMALAAYFINYLGGNWSGVLQVVFLAAAGITLLLLLFSGQIRTRLRVWLSKNFFSYKYDYRTEWLEFTQTLAKGTETIPANITRAIANLAKSNSGLLWSRTEDGHYNLVTHWEMPHPGADIDLDELPQWLETHEWIIDLREWRHSPDMYQNLKLPGGISEINKAGLIIPLLFGERLQGILLLRESDLLKELNWEDRDLLKVAGRQAASHLAQFQSDQALIESRQFEAFNRLSAYVIHDLKNILAQLSLMVANAQKHKSNPEFIDDMVDTVSNSVTRMSKLMAQLRSEAYSIEQQEFSLPGLLEEVVAECTVRAPAPEFVNAERDFRLTCDKERLHTVFSHLIQNAQEATTRQGRVSVRLETDEKCALVEIEDDGIGMEQEFIQHRLFKPFDSTKGLTGMGIGAFESRDFVRGIGGDIKVRSTPGAGSLFQVRIPGPTGAR